MSIRMRFVRSAFAFLLAAMSSPSIAEDHPSGTCDRSAADPPAPAIPMTDYSAESNEIIDPEEEAADATWHAYQTSVFDALSTSSDPRSWALAVLIDVEGSRASGDALIKRATIAAPNDTLVLWITLGQRQETLATARKTALRMLENLEPDNAAVWNETLVSATLANDSAGVDTALAHMASSANFNGHSADMMKALIDVYRRYPIPEDYIRLISKSHPELLIQDMGNFAATLAAYSLSLPPFQHMVTACRLNPATNENALRSSNCAAVGKIMANGDTLIANAIGFALLRASRTFTDEDVQNARRLDWIRQQWDGVIASADGQAESAQYIIDWIGTGSETQAMRLAISRAAKPTTPPVEWVDSQSPFSQERMNTDQAALERATKIRH